MEREELKGTIEPLITIDHFVPKSGIDTEVTVVSLYANDREPADDLNRFIQRGSIDVLDIEVSPNPDEDGRYLVFVEFKRDEMFPEVFKSFVHDIENVTGSLNWRVHPFAAEHEMMLDDPDLFGFVITTPYSKDEQEDLNTARLSEMLSNSSVDKLTSVDNTIIINDSLQAKVVKLGDTEIYFDYKLNESIVVLNIKPEVKLLERLIGPQYSVTEHGKYVSVIDELSENVLILSDLETYIGKATSVL